MCFVENISHSLVNTAYSTRRKPAIYITLYNYTVVTYQYTILYSIPNVGAKLELGWISTYTSNTAYVDLCTTL